MNRAPRPGTLAARAAALTLALLLLDCETTAPPPPPARSATATAPTPSPTPTPESPARATAPEPASAPASQSPALPSSAPTAALTPSPCHVALIGDSLTDFASHGGAFVRYLEARCPRSRFDNFAKGGAMVNQMRRKLESRVLPEATAPFSHVLVFGGVNDLYSDETAGRTVAKIEADLAAIYRAAKAHGARVVALTVAPWGGFTRYFTPHRADTTRELNAWILAQPSSGTVDATTDAWSLLSCGDADRLCERYENAHSDGIHFGKAGHEVLGQALYDAEFHACP